MLKMLITQPLLLAADIMTTAEFYKDSLGFVVQGFNYRGDKEIGCTVTRDDVVFTFHKAKGMIAPNHTMAEDWEPPDQEIMAVDVYIFVTDVHAYCAELKERDVAILKEPTGQYMPQMIVRDCNGYLLSFVQFP